MAISLLGSVASATDDTVSSVTASHTLSAGSDREIYAVVAQTWVDAGDTCDSVTYNGTNMTQIGSSPSGDNSSLFRAVSVWRLLEASFPANGTYNVQANFGESVAVVSIFVFTLQDCNQSTLEDTDNYKSSGSNTATYSMTTVTDNAAAITATMHDGLNSFTHGSGQTELFDTQVNKPTTFTVTASLEVIASAGAATQTDDYGGGSDRMTGVCWVIKPKAAAANTSNFFFLWGM